MSATSLCRLWIGRAREREREETKSLSKVVEVSLPSSRTVENQRVLGPGATKTMRCLSILLGPAWHQGGAMIHEILDIVGQRMKS